MKPLLIGIDSGTTSTKAILFDTAGRVLAEFSEGYEFADSEPGHIEQNAEDWWRAAANGIRHLAAAAKGKGQVRALALSTQGATVVPVEEEYRPLANAVTWLDKRAREQVERISAGLLPGFVVERTGMDLGAWGVLGKMAWWRDERPELFASAAAFAQVNDFLMHRLTGVNASDPSNAAIAGLYNLRTGGWAEDLLALADVSSARLAPLVRSGAPVGACRRIHTHV